MNRENIYKQYVYAGIVIGFLQILDGISFAFNWNSNLNTAYSWLELMWFLFSIIVLVMLSRDRLPIQAPLIYVSYILLNVAMATLVFEPAESAPGYTIPGWFTLITICCGLAFIYSLAILFQRHLNHRSLN